MSFDDTIHRCGSCASVVSDHDPGVSSIYQDGLVFHPECAPVEPTPLHSYARASGERVEITIDEQGAFVARVDGELHHRESAMRSPHRYTVRTGKARAIEYERQDHEYTASLTRTA